MAGARLRVRTRNARRPDRYGALLVFILLDCVAIFTSAQQGLSRWLPAVLVAATVMVGLETSQVSGWWVTPTRALALLIVVASVYDAGDGNDTALAWIALAQAVALAILVVAIIGRIFKHDRVTSQTVLAVLCVYVLFALIFALLAYSVSGIYDRQFFVQEADPSLADFVYFSFVVLCTLGFGDLTPATDGGKAMVSFEALLGQIYLVTVVSRLVGLYTRAPRPDPGQGSADSGSPLPAE